MIGLPSLKTIVGLCGFFFGWTMQHKCHAELASLKKYSLPQGGMFRYLVCPHYTCEIIIYASLAVLASPQGLLYNRTLVCAAMFIAVNLGATASGTKEWYIGKFGREAVQSRWKMVPLLF